MFEVDVKNVTEEEIKGRRGPALVVFFLGTENIWLLNTILGGLKGILMSSAGARIRKTVVTQNSSLYNI